MIRLGIRGWELYGGPACADCTPYPGLRDAFWARLWLRQFKSDPAVLYQLRHLVLESNTSWPLRSATSDQVIDWMAKLLADGQWHVHAPVLADTGGAAGGESSAAEEVDLADVVSSLPDLPDSPAPPPPPQEEGQLPRSADEAAIAAGMKLAAQLGIPFCEECARAALKRAGETANA
ncbi:MAG TPA: hypothetical protein VGL00_15560 [Terracidiphilus sp.]